MLFVAVLHPINKNVVAKEESLNPTTCMMGTKDTKENIRHWGESHYGFEGSIRGYGFGIYHGPITKRINQQLAGNTKD